MPRLRRRERAARKKGDTAIVWYPWLWRFNIEIIRDTVQSHLLQIRLAEGDANDILFHALDGAMRHIVGFDENGSALNEEVGGEARSYFAKSLPGTINHFLAKLNNRRVRFNNRRTLFNRHTQAPSYKMSPDERYKSRS